MEGVCECVIRLSDLNLRDPGLGLRALKQTASCSCAEEKQSTEETVSVPTSQRRCQDILIKLRKTRQISWKPQAIEKMLSQQSCWKEPVRSVQAGGMCRDRMIYVESLKTYSTPLLKLVDHGNNMRLLCPKSKGLVYYSQQNIKQVAKEMRIFLPEKAT